MSRAFPLALFSLVVASGCYRHHERADAGGVTDAPVRDTPPRDAGPDAIDACTPPVVDPGPLPPEADVPAGARPSELPGAAAWVDPPEPHGGPCCDVRYAEDLACLPRARAVHASTWNGVEWVARYRTWDRSGPIAEWLVRFDADLRPVGAPVAIPYDDPAYWYSGGAGTLILRWWIHDDWEPHALVLDRGGTIVRDTPIPIDAVHATRVVSQHAWAILGDDESRRSRRAILVLYDDMLREIGRVDFGEPGSTAGTNVRVTEIGGRLLTLEADDTMGVIDVRAFEGPGLREVDRSDWTGLGTGRGLRAVASLRDELFVVLEAGGARYSLAARDAFSGTATLEPTQFLPAFGSGSRDASVIATDDVGGTIAVCVETREGFAEPVGRIEVHLFDAMGQLLGEPVELARGEGVGGCHLARSAPDTYVAYWSSTDDEFDGAIDGATITVRR